MSDSYRYGKSLNNDAKAHLLPPIKGRTSQVANTLPIPLLVARFTYDGAHSRNAWLRRISVLVCSRSVPVAALLC